MRWNAPAGYAAVVMFVDLRKCLTGMYGTRQANDLLGILSRTPRGRAELLHFGRLLVPALPAAASMPGDLPEIRNRIAHAPKPPIRPQQRYPP